MRHLSEPYSEQQGAPEGVQGQVAKEGLQHCCLQEKTKTSALTGHKAVIQQRQVSGFTYYN